MLKFKIKEKYKIKSDIVVICKSANDYYVQGPDCLILYELWQVKHQYNKTIQMQESVFSKDICDSCRIKLDANNINNMLIEVSPSIHDKNQYQNFYESIKDHNNGPAVKITEKEIRFDENPQSKIHEIKKEHHYKRADHEMASAIYPSQKDKDCRHCMLHYRGDCNGFTVCDDYKEKYNITYEERAGWPTSEEMHKNIRRGFRDRQF